MPASSAATVDAGAGRLQSSALHSIDAEHRAAVLLQKRVRIYQAKALAFRKVRAATQLQHWYVRRKTMVLFRKCHAALRKLQRDWREHLQRKQQRLDMKRAVEEAQRRQAEEKARAEADAATAIQSNVRRYFCVRRYHLTRAALAVQRLVRGHLGRLRSAKHRQQLLIKVMWCRNCDHPEPGGGRCKFCGRKLATIEKLPHQLRAEGLAGKTFTYYGFNHCFSRKFTAAATTATVGTAAAAASSGTTTELKARGAPQQSGAVRKAARVSSYVLVEVPHPDQTPINKRASLQAAREDEDFDRRRYMVEHLAVRREQQQQQQQQQRQLTQLQRPRRDGSGTGPLAAFLAVDLQDRGRHAGGSKAALKQHVQALAAAAAGREGSFDEKISLQPWQVLVRPKMVTANLERMQLWTPSQALLHAWDIVAAFTHEKRLRAAQYELRAPAGRAQAAGGAHTKVLQHRKLAKHTAVPPLTPTGTGAGTGGAFGTGAGPPGDNAGVGLLPPPEKAAVDCFQVVKLSASLSWLATLRTPQAVLRSTSRRILCYSDGARHWPAVRCAFEDATAVFEAGPPALLAVLAELHTLFERASERTQFHSELFLTDFVCWAEQLAPDALRGAVRELRKAMQAFAKADTGFPLEQLEADAAQSAVLLGGAASSSGGGVGGREAGPPPDSEAAWAQQYLQMRQLDKAPKKPNF